MPLVDLRLPPGAPDPPHDVQAFLREAGRRVERFREGRRLPGFVPSDFGAVYAGLQGLDEENLAPGRWFCEWGSGFGVAACLAALLGFDACGIEIEGELVDESRRLADDFGLPVQFARGSFLPAAADARACAAGGFAWLATGEVCGHQALGLDPDDFDVIFAYPWPDEERLTAALFDRYARPGAVLATYHGGDAVRLRRREGRKRARR
jgi:hypothetical protein